MSRPPTLDPMAQRAVRICYTNDDSMSQTVLGQIFGCSRDVIARTVAGISRTAHKKENDDGHK
jgi:hypothetical protein